MALKCIGQKEAFCFAVVQELLSRGCDVPAGGSRRRRSFGGVWRASRRIQPDPDGNAEE